MKKGVLVLLFLLLFSLASALGEETIPAFQSDKPVYEAYSYTKFNIRDTPEDSGRKIKAIEPGEKVSVFAYGTDWCILSYQGVTGYAKTKWLYRFRSLLPFTAKVPGAQLQAGMAEIRTPAHAKVAKYSGNQFKKGDKLSILRLEGDAAVLSMMRGTTQIPAAALSFEPFMPWDKAEPGDMIGGFTTYYNESTGDKHGLGANRRWNIELAANRVNGTVIKVGGSFSYFGQCGPNTQKNGYRLAPNISKRGVGYGGGVCQLVTTIYNAALGLPLQITEWSLHRDIGVPYIPQGFDAAVSSYSDFVFKNTLPYDIQLEALSQDGVLTVVITRNAL